MSKKPKVFVIKHTFNNFMSIEKHETHFTEPEIHYNLPWKIGIFIDRSHVYFYFMCCEKFSDAENWRIDTKIDLKFIKNNELFSTDLNISKELDSDSFLKKIALEELEKYLVDGNLEIEYRIEILNIEGIGRSNLIDFDESNIDFSDVVVLIGYERFYLIKKYLAFHSAYFNSLFFGNSEDSEIHETELVGVDPEDFQNFLELIYGETCVKGKTLNGMLKLAEFFKSETVKRKCENYLLGQSYLSVTEKFKLAIKYKMDKLKKSCFPKLKTIEEIRSVIPEDLTEFDVTVWNELLLNVLAIKEKQ
ncbi:unnamed protein product [Caenorhabditis nigoni]